MPMQLVEFVDELDIAMEGLCRQLQRCLAALPCRYRAMMRPRSRSCRARVSAQSAAPPLFQTQDMVVEMQLGILIVKHLHVLSAVQASIEICLNISFSSM